MTAERREKSSFVEFVNFEAQHKVVILCDIVATQVDLLIRSLNR